MIEQTWSFSLNHQSPLSLKDAAYCYLKGRKNFWYVILRCHFLTQTGGVIMVEIYRRIVYSKQLKSRLLFIEFSSEKNVSVILEFTFFAFSG